MKFIDFGKQLAKPVKFIKQHTAFLPKPIQQAATFAMIFAGLPVFLVGFTVLRVLNGTLAEDISTNEVAYNLNGLENTINEIGDDSESDIFSISEANTEDGYRDGYDGFGVYMNGILFEDDNDDEDSPTWKY